MRGFLTLLVAASVFLYWVWPPLLVITLLLQLSLILYWRVQYIYNCKEINTLRKVVLHLIDRERSRIDKEYHGTEGWVPNYVDFENSIKKEIPGCDDTSDWYDFIDELMIEK